MKINSLTLNVTDACNFRCAYCPQTHENIYLPIETIDKALDFFFPFMDAEQSYLNIYGGEPLLAFDSIRHMVGIREKKKKETGKTGGYSLTTNGSLLDENILRFLDEHRFTLMLSFDGLATNRGRKAESYDAMVNAIKALPRYKNISFSTNSVFIPETVNQLADSMIHILELGVKELRFTLSTVEEWTDEDLALYREQLEKLTGFLTAHYRETGNIPIREFRKDTSEGIFGCFAAQDRMTVAADGTVWGCYLMPDFFKDKKDTCEIKKYSLGSLDEFMQNHESILAEKLGYYKELNQCNFYTDDT
ncbi:MAG: radical SAM protein, partial [bacterium]|nr:radical SAM protein [bacterium]